MCLLVCRKEKRNEPRKSEAPTRDAIQVCATCSHLISSNYASVVYIMQSTVRYVTARHGASMSASKRTRYQDASKN